MQISLVPLDGGEPFVITLPLTLVGRKESCEFSLEAEGIADLHCVLAQTENVLLLRDLDTGNIRVNGQRCRRAVLLPNDLLTIANCNFRVRHNEEGGVEPRSN
jgi:pSer/pThr/pTyr-binding forkhead associated (FHA) protein